MIKKVAKKAVKKVGKKATRRVVKKATLKILRRPMSAGSKKAAKKATH